MDEKLAQQTNWEGETEPSLIIVQEIFPNFHFDIFQSIQSRFSSWFKKVREKLFNF